MTEARPRKQVNIYTDGACSGNPGPGGWGCILEFGPHRKEMSGYMAGTTNNRMEMTAAIRGLEALKRPARVTLSTDSRYVMDGLTKWIAGMPASLVLPSSHRLKSGASTPMKAAGRSLRICASRLRRMPESSR